NKSPGVYGAFPSDPYSHTPGHAGAKQPGMTGQVKEDIISRWGELGVQVKDGHLVFNPVLLRRSEFIDEPQPFRWIDLDGHEREQTLEFGMLGFTYAQTLVTYQISDTPRITVTPYAGAPRSLPGLRLDAETSAAVLNRTGQVLRLHVELTPLLA
ncbi:MAG: hypothetical protein AAGJ92_09835, partial [Pseudomonadota bacterium]